MKKLFSLLTLALLTMSAVAGNYVKVTSTSDLADGNYLIVYEDGGVAFNGALTTLDVASNTVAVTIDNGVIEPTDAIMGAAFTIDMTAGTIKSASGYYVGRTTDANGMLSSDSEAYTNTISIDDDGNAVILSSGGAYMRYNTTSGQTRFRYFKSSTYTNQKAIQLYKWNDGDAPVVELAAPVFHPAGGEITQSTEVTLTCATENASIYYWEGTEEEQGEWIYYNAPFYVNETKTYTAVSTKGSDMSDYVTVTFTKVLPTLEAPTFTPATGATFEDELDVVINAAEGATILYTVNDDVFEGTAPVTVTLNETSTITAMASMEGYNNSEEVSATYTKVEPYTVGGTATFVAGVDEDPNVEYRKQADITISKDNVTMAYNGTMYDYYTIVDGDTTGVTYTYRIYKNQSIKFTSAAGNIRKIEFNCEESNPVTGFNAVDGLNMETATWEGNAREVTFTAGSKQVRALTITVTLDDQAPAIIVADPVIDPANNTRFVNSQEVTITCATEGAAVYYSINDAEYQPYTAAFNINETATVKAYAELEGVQSNVVTAKYYKLTEVSTLAQVNALNDSTDFIFYGNVVVTYQNGSNLWVKDATGYGLIYGNQVPKDIPVGSTLKEEWDAMYTLYRGAINEYCFPNGVAVAEDEPVVEIVPTEYTSAQITTDVINERVILKGITLLDGEGKYMYNAADSLVIYNNFNITKPEDFTKAYDVEGMVSYYGGKVQIMPIAITEAASVDFLRGDVDNNGEVKIGDVTALISYLLSGDDSEINILAADCDQNGEVKIGDVTTLISYLLSGNWGE